MSVAFDTLKAARRLSEAGFSEEQAATLASTFAEGITENLATRDDVALVRKDMEVLRKDMKALDTRIDTSVEGLRKDMIAIKKDMTILLGSIMVGGIVVMTLLDRLLAN